MSNLAWINNKKLDENEFYNRISEISNIMSLLNLTSTNNAPSLLVTGVRSVGKTVFLNHIKRLLDEDYLVVYMDFSRADCYQQRNMTPIGLLEHYYTEIIKECKKRQFINFDYRIKKYFKTNDFHIKSFTKVNDISIPLFESNKNFNKIKDFVFNLPYQISKDYSTLIKGVIIMIDEIQVLRQLGDYMDSFLWLFRSYTQEHNNIAYVLSGSMSLQDELIPKISSTNGAFGGRLLTIHLDPFNKETTRNYLSEKAEDLLFTDESFERFYKCTGGIPAYINVLGNLLPKNETLTEEMIIKNFDENLPSIIVHLINQWNKLSVKEKNIFISLLEKPLKRKQIAEKLGVTTGSLSLSLKKLQNLGLLKVTENVYHINEKLLARWIKLEYKEYGSYPYVVN